MLACSPALNSFLLSGAPYIGADLYVITLISGQVMYLTSLNRNVTYTGTISGNPDYGTNTYLSLGQSGSGAPMIQRSQVSKKVGLNSSKIDVEVFAVPGTLIMNQEILVTIALGYWSNAQVWVRRAFILPTDVPLSWNAPIPTNLGGSGDGTLVWFSGFVGKINELGPLNAKIEVRDLLWQLNRPLPRNLFGPGCYKTLYDAGCTVNKGAFTFTGSVLSGSTTTSVEIAQTKDQGIPSAPVFGSNPLNKATTKYAIPAVTYYAQATYVTALGETIASAEWSIACAPDYLITMASPPSISGASYWNCYVGTETGDEQLQQATIPIGTSWTENTGGVALSGIGPPPLATNGFFSLGTFSITYGGGALNGQTYSSFIETSFWNGSSTTVTLRVPLPQAPTTSDSYSVSAGCDKRSTTCGSNPSIGYEITLSGDGKFGNLLNHGGFTFLPPPETAV
jgi:hypothetical protein